MKDEIKEILHWLDHVGNKVKNDDALLELGVNDCKILLDYIINLQEENERYAEKLTCKVEENKIPEKLETINSDFYVSDCYGENYERLSKEEIALDLVSLKNWINFIIDYLKTKENK